MADLPQDSPPSSNDTPLSFADFWLAVSTLIFLTVLIPSTSRALATLMGIVLLASVVLGLGWLLFKRCKFTTAQLLITIGLIAVTMLLLAEPPHSDAANTNNLVLMFSSTLGSFTGMFIGVRVAGDPTGKSKSSYWALFFFGLFSPILIPAALAVLIFGAMYLSRVLGS